MDNTAELLEKIRIFSDIIRNIFTIIAMIIDGIWAYYKFFKSRVFHSRIEMNIIGQTITRNEVDFLICNASLKKCRDDKV